MCRLTKKTAYFDRVFKNSKKCAIETHRTPTGDGDNNVKLIFKMENKRGARITNVSQSGQPEGEVLHKTNESCTIKSVRKQGFYYVATLEDSE